MRNQWVFEFNNRQLDLRQLAQAQPYLGLPVPVLLGSLIKNVFLRNGEYLCVVYCVEFVK